MCRRRPERWAQRRVTTACSAGLTVTAELQHDREEELILAGIRTLLRRVPTWSQRWTRPGADPLLASDAARARARAAADHHNRVGDPGHTAGM
jgi:hypothetical protein